MQIIGRGFMARHLAPVADRHPDVVALAAGVSWASQTAQADFDREAALVAATVQECRASGRRLLFFSTSSPGMYGRATGPVHEDDAIEPANPYGVHKLGLERVVADSGVDALVLRMAHLVGPGQPDHQLLPTLVRLLRAGRVTVHDGARRDLIDVAHVVRIVDRLLTDGVRGTVNVASGHSVQVEAVVDHLEDILGTAAERAHQPGGSAHHVSVQRLCALVPETAGFGFGPGYFRGVVTRFVAAADTWTDKAA